MKLMSLNELQLCLDAPEIILGQELLSWFASQNQAKAHRDEFTFAGQKTNISRDIHYFLEKDFNEAFSLEAQSIDLAENFCSNIAVIDLKKLWRLKFPFFCSSNAWR